MNGEFIIETYWNWGNEASLKICYLLLTFLFLMTHVLVETLSQMSLILNIFDPCRSGGPQTLKLPNLLKAFSLS